VTGRRPVIAKNAVTRTSTINRSSGISGGYTSGAPTRRGWPWEHEGDKSRHHQLADQWQADLPKTEPSPLPIKNLDLIVPLVDKAIEVSAEGIELQRRLDRELIPARKSTGPRHK
jgi:hypothetical protein